MKADEYVFIYYHKIPTNFTFHPWESDDTMNIFKPLIQITVSSLAGEKVTDFLYEVQRESANAPFYQDMFLNNKWLPSTFSVFTYETMLTVCNVLNRTSESNINIRDMDQMMNFSKYTTFEGRFGKIKFDNNADRLPDYWVWHFDSLNKEYTHWLDVEFTNNDTRVFLVADRTWSVPSDVPKCGFQNELCPESSTSSKSKKKK